jgi:hypothetical protein
LQLRVAGVSLQAIADRLGYADQSGAYRAVMSALAKARREPAEQMREMVTQRLDRMLQSVWPRVLQGELDAIHAALRIEERRARLLGLDKAQKVDITILVEALAHTAGRDVDEALAEADHILRHPGKHYHQ